MSITRSDVFNSLFKTLSDSDILGADLRHQVSSAICLKRQELEMSQKEFSEFMGVSQSMVSKWESYSYNFSLNNVGDIFAKLDIPITFDMNNTDQKYTNNQSYGSRPSITWSTSLLKGA